MNNQLYKLNPSGLSFLYEGCKRCFYLNVVYNIRQPSMPLPGIFSKIANLLKEHYNGKYTKELHPTLSNSNGIVAYGEKYVRSKIIELPNRKSTCYISGRFDIVAKFEDGSYGIIDFKTGSPKNDHNILYGRQLHAYLYALENPADGALKLTPISKLGLLYFHPGKTRQDNIEQLLYEADIHWVEIERDDKKFLNFLDDVMKILESDQLPESSPNCDWCNYRDRLKEFK